MAQAMKTAQRLPHRRRRQQQRSVIIWHRGEQTANALEANLTNLHSKLDALLSELGVPALEDEEEASASPEHDGNHQSGGGAGTNGDKKKPVT
ncbi:hypothetical protein B0H66DRAFT_8829 [Apodospora peruviana]|uniref:Uncharacterized protein n=1 Tax=Apodospora peruviana TaxID=516989 RepID=A0AAE0IPR1_9PEZI|nr:hypothetical protein B0H66DRAFT_8829 [Apodospora peruviana]